MQSQFLAKDTLQSLVEQNQELVYRTALRLAKSSDRPYESLVAVGYYGLCEAVREFVEGSELFSAYALQKIESAIKNFEQDKPNPLSVLTTSQLPYPLRQAFIMLRVNQVSSTIAGRWLGIKPNTTETYCSEASRKVKELLFQFEAPKQVRDQPDYGRERTTQPRDALPYLDKDGNLHIPEFRGTCEYCDRIFGIWQTPKNPPRCCSRVCSTRLGKKSEWLPKELDYLKFLVGSYPRKIVIEKYQETAKSRQWTDRTDVAVTVMLKRIAKSTKATQDNWSISELARQLGVGRDRVWTWVRTGKLHRQELQPGLLVITRSDLSLFFQNYQNCIAGIDPEKIAIVTQSPELVDLAKSHSVLVKRIEVTRTDTQETYPSVHAAARAMGIDRRTIRDQLRNPDNWLRSTTVVADVRGVSMNINLGNIISQSRPQSEWHGICEVCQQAFTAKKPRRTCSDLHAGRLARADEWKPIQCLSTGQTFRCVAEAAEAVGVHPSSIARAARHVNLLRKSYWQYLPKELTMSDTTQPTKPFDSDTVSDVFPEVSQLCELYGTDVLIHDLQQLCAQNYHHYQRLAKETEIEADCQRLQKFANYWLQLANSLHITVQIALKG